MKDRVSTGEGRIFMDGVNRNIEKLMDEYIIPALNMKISRAISNFGAELAAIKVKAGTYQFDDLSRRVCLLEKELMDLKVGIGAKLLEKI